MRANIMNAVVKAVKIITHMHDDEIAYFTVRWKTRASFVYRTKNVDNNEKDSKNRKRSH